MNTVAVRERPILFSGEMVRAILDGRKSQTRRVLGVQPLEILLPRDRRTKSFNAVTRVVDGRRAWFGLTHRDEKFDSLNRGVVFYCKYGEVGDRLWVREKCRLEWIEEDDVYWIRYAADDYLDEPPDVEGLTAWCERAKWAAGIEPGQEVTPWRLSIHMPRWASRLTFGDHRGPGAARAGDRRARPRRRRYNLPPLSQPRLPRIRLHLSGALPGALGLAQRQAWLRLGREPLGLGHFVSEG